MSIGSHGLATYLGAGAIGGDKLRILQQSERYEHELTLRGNVLFVPFEEIDDASYIIAEHAGVDIDDVAGMAPGKRLNKVLRENSVDGIRYSSFILHSEIAEGKYMVEGVVLNPANNVYVQGITHQSPAPQAARRVLRLRESVVSGRIKTI